MNHTTLYEELLSKMRNRTRFSRNARTQLLDHPQLLNPMEKIDISKISSGSAQVRNRGGYSCNVAREVQTTESMRKIAEKLNELIDALSPIN